MNLHILTYLYLDMKDLSLRLLHFLSDKCNLLTFAMFSKEESVYIQFTKKVYYRNIRPTEEVEFKPKLD